MKKINNNEIDLVLKVEIFKNIVDVSIPLKQNKINQEEILSNLIKQNKELKNVNKEIKNEVINLKTSIKNLELKIELINNRLKNLEKTINENNTNNIAISESVIVRTKEQNNLIINRLKQIPYFFNLKKNNCSFKLLYKGTRDGDKSETFHNLCDNKNNILVLVETTKNRKLRFLFYKL